MPLKTATAAATLVSFSAGAYTAVVNLDGGLGAFLEDVPVARDIASGEMIADRRVMLFFADETNQNEAVVIAVWT